MEAPMSCRAVIAAVVFICVMGPLDCDLSVVHGETAQEFAWCSGGQGASTEQRISGCTAIVESARLKGKSLGKVFTLRGIARLHLKPTPDLEGGIHDLGQAIDLNPEDEYAFFGRADALKLQAYQSPDSERKRLARLAADDFTQAIRLRAPPVPLDYIDRSNAYTLLSDFDSALSDLGKALQVDPSDKREALVNRCYVYGRVERWSDALADCNQSLMLKNNEGPDSNRESNTLIARGYVHLRMGNYRDAVADYNVAILDPHTGERRRAEALFGRGFAQNKLEAGTGQEDVATAVKSWPEVIRYFSDRGLK